MRRGGTVGGGDTGQSDAADISDVFHRGADTAVHRENFEYGQE